MILESGPYGCYDDYIVNISGIMGQEITQPGVYNVTVTDPDTGNSCWGLFMLKTNCHLLSAVSSPCAICSICRVFGTVKTMILHLVLVGPSMALPLIQVYFMMYCNLQLPLVAIIHLPWMTHRCLMA